MAVRQYIGARYVPKFFENPNGSNEWLANYSYESLMIVLYNNSSYTSKKPVPANIGNPAENKDYWVRTGNYNGQVEEYARIVETFNEAINKNVADIKDLKETTAGAVDISERSKLLTLTGKTIAFIGDSWTVGNGVSSSDAYPSVVGRKLSMNVINYAVGGSGFVRKAGGTGKTFNDQLTDMINAINNGTKIDYLCVMGGFNDTNNGTDKETLRNACLSFLSRLNTEVPDVVLVWMGYNMRCYTITEAFRAGMFYVNSAYKTFNGIVLGANDWQYDLIGYPSYYNNDNVHPSVNGHKVLANAVINTMMGVGSRSCATYSLVNDFSPFSQCTATGEWAVKRVDYYVEITIGTLNTNSAISATNTESTYTLPSVYTPAYPEAIDLYFTTTGILAQLVVTATGKMYIHLISGTIPANTNIHVPTMRYPLYSRS